MSASSRRATSGCTEKHSRRTLVLHRLGDCNACHNLCWIRTLDCAHGGKARSPFGASRDTRHRVPRLARHFSRAEQAGRDREHSTSPPGDVRIDRLARNAGLSVRQFDRSFLQEVGVRPKLYARIARFEAALDCKARSSTKSWTDVAHEFGSYNQMHMVHDFTDFTGETPTSTMTQVEAIFREQIETI